MISEPRSHPAIPVAHDSNTCCLLSTSATALHVLRRGIGIAFISVAVSCVFVAISATKRAKSAASHVEDREPTSRTWDVRFNIGMPLASSTNVDMGKLHMTERRLKNKVKAVKGQCIEFDQRKPCFVPSKAQCGKKAESKAIVIAHDFYEPFDPFDKLVQTYLTNKNTTAKNLGAEFIMLIPKGSSISTSVQDELFRIGLSFREVPWVVPPNLSKDVPRESGGCCGAREFIKLHAFNMTEFDAIIFYDMDIEIRLTRVAALTSLFDCACSGYFLTTPARHHNPWVNGGFFAVRPSSGLFETMLRVLSRAHVDPLTGWNDAGWGPGWHSNVPKSLQSQFRMQGFLSYFMYQDKRHMQYVQAEQLDQCIWNRQRHSVCPEVSCKSTLIFHDRLHSEHPCKGHKLF